MIFGTSVSVEKKKEKAIQYQIDPTTLHHHPCQNIAVTNLLSPVASNKLLTSTLTPVKTAATESANEVAKSNKPLSTVPSHIFH